jgi:hypothetical protein
MRRCLHLPQHQPSPPQNAAPYNRHAACMARVLLSSVPLDAAAFDSVELELPSGAPALVILNDDSLYEILGSSSCDFCSAFVGNSVLSNGSPLLLSPVDVNFLVLHHTLFSSNKSLSPTDDLLIDALPPALRKYGRSLSGKVNWQSICECKNVGGDLYARGNETIALAWLKGRVAAAASALSVSGAQDRSSLLDALSICKRFVDPSLFVRVCSLFSVSEGDFKDKVEVPVVCAAPTAAEAFQDKSAKKVKDTPKKGPCAADAKGSASILSFFSPGAKKK